MAPATPDGDASDRADPVVVDPPPVVPADPVNDGGTGSGRIPVEPPGRLDPGRHGWTFAGVTGLIVAVACSLFVLMQLRPELLLTDTTPAGGDMGAHVWGPAYLRDHLLSEGRLTGWTPDWYAGFPAYHFYMVVPALAIIAVNAGLPPLIAVPVGVGLIAAAVWWVNRRGRFGRTVLALAVVLAILLVQVPYGVAFKLVSVSGVVGIPLAAWSMGRLARSREPVPAFLAVGATVFLFDTNFTIYGGNIASTLAGEFAFSISLCLALVVIGLAIRGMDQRAGRVAAALVIALVALCHIIPLFFTIVALAVVATLDERIPRLWPAATGLALGLVPVAMGEGNGVGILALSLMAVVVVFVALAVAEPVIRGRYLWLAVTGPVAALLTMFWLLPFYVREPYFNDMGWERLEDVASGLFTEPMRVALPVAAVGALLAYAVRDRVGMLFSTLGLVSAAMVANWGDGPLWNARLLPFFYLAVYLVAGVGLAIVVQVMAAATTERLSQPDQRVVALSSGLALVLALVGISIPLRSLPFGSAAADGSYTMLGITSSAKSFLPSWIGWNYSGYERKASYREYRTVIATMDRIGREDGCGRAMWEYSPDLDRYGTPMALMLLPHWTDGCIGSMEGLYFESSATTPFHFLNQSLLSVEPSRAQRDLPYQGFDIDAGVAELQVMGVRYYLAQSDEAIAAARSHPQLTEVAEAQPFVVFEVDDTSLVHGLEFEPVVTSGLTEDEAGSEATRFDVGWESQAVTYYNDPAAYQAMPAEDGPPGWERVTTLRADDGVALDPVEVSDVEATRSGIDFRVDEVGVPVLVKMSYFPNWSVDGAEGPWRVGPNLMVVVPTETSVSLHYGWTTIDWLAWVISAIGMLNLVALHRMDRRGLARLGASDHLERWEPRSPLEIVTSVVDGRRGSVRPRAGSGDGGMRVRDRVPPPVRPAPPGGPGRSEGAAGPLQPPRWEETTTGLESPPELLSGDEADGEPPDPVGTVDLDAYDPDLLDPQWGPPAPEAVDSEAVDSEAVDSEAVDSEAVDSEAVDRDPIRSAPAGPGTASPNGGSEVVDGAIDGDHRPVPAPAGDVPGDDDAPRGQDRPEDR